MLATRCLKTSRCLTTALLIACGLAQAPAQVPVADALLDGFNNPPAAALPRTWWHWTNGHVTTEGITKDLEWMQRVGIGGFQLADVAAGGGQTIDKPLPFGSPEWLAAVKHAASEAKRLGLEMTIFSSSGWSLTGGPWVKPEQAMKKLVWSETTVEGGKDVSLKLPQPPSNNSSFLDMGASRPGRDPTYYADSAVIAFPTPAAETTMADAKPMATSSGWPLAGVEEDRLYDGSYAVEIRVEAEAEGKPAWIQYEFAEPFTARAITLAGSGGIPVGRVLASDDGETWRPLVALPGAQLYRQFRVRTLALPETHARFYRIEFTGAPLGPAITMNQPPSPPAKSYALFEAQLHSGARINRWEEKAGFGHLFEYASVPTPRTLPDAAIPTEDVLDLTPLMAADGTLNWSAPSPADGSLTWNTRPSKWTILRMGYSLTGAKNRPATPAGSGYEVDKLSSKHTTAYYEAYAGILKGALGDLYGSGLACMLLDSWEAGTQNWTDEMLAQFRERRGYDPTPYLPALTGRIVGDADASDRFLWDFRRTLADMFADNHYSVMNELLHRDGLRTYSEASGVSLEIPEDTLLNKSKVDIPMGEFWVRDLHPRLMYFQDVRGAASAAHVYGKPFVAAEAFTGGGYESPFTLKKVADYWMAQGINRLVIHTSAHQPLDTKPGNTMVGTHLNRNITWAEQARPFMLYLSRVSYMLQQGQFVADVAYLLDEGAPSTPPIWGAGTQPEPPAGYDYDFLNADALLNRVTVDADGRLQVDGGMSYRVLALPESRQMRPKLLRKLRELVTGGATIVGPKPLASPSLMGGGMQADREVADLTAELWGDLNGVSRNINYVGKGRVIWGLSLAETLRQLQVLRDFEFAGGFDDEIACLHRHTADADIYYVANLADQLRRLAARFRVTGKEAAILHPDDGSITPAGYAISDGRTTVELNLDPHEPVFVVFRESTDENSRTVASRQLRPLATISGPWEFAFSPNLGAPATTSMEKLASWTESEDPGVKFFSGTAVYTTHFTAPATPDDDATRLVLDLGDVRDIAEVKLNGESLGTVWKPPYRVDHFKRLKPGDNANTLEIAVTNQWTNRITGDARVEPAQRVLKVRSAGRFGGPPREPLPSGLLGPVTILIELPAE
jgi:hypothetical protein